MIKEEIAPGIIVYSDVIPNSESLYLEIEEAMSSVNMTWSQAEVKDETQDPRVNTKSRDTSTFGVPYQGMSVDIENKPVSEIFVSNLNNLFFENFDPREKDYMNFYGVETKWHDTYGVLKYGSGQKFTNHIDDHQLYHRRISTVYYLNENYTGGEINFPRFNLTIKPKANQMIVFPSNYIYNHSVSPVIEGERYAVVSWLT
jgi:hypothetical protein